MLVKTNHKPTKINTIRLPPRPATGYYRPNPILLLFLSRPQFSTVSLPDWLSPSTLRLVMEGSSSRKRPFSETEFADSEKSNSLKKVKFPKGKKVKLAPEHIPSATHSGNDVVPEGQDSVADPRVAAKKRAEQRGRMTTHLCTEEEHQFSDLSMAEVQYEENENFVEDGIQIEPFNLDKEREEGYFDAAGNFVEYVGEKEEKDAWLDNLEVDPQLAKKLSKLKSKEVVVEEEGLSSDDIGQIKRRIADALDPSETVLQALRRLKGNSNSRKEKMSAETKVVFDQLTEDAMKLMDNGDYDVYHESQELFQREAEGYERLVQARKNGLSSTRVATNASADATTGPSSLNISTIDVQSAGDETFDMFGGDDENVSINASSDESKVFSSNGHAMSNQTSSGTEDPGFVAGQTDYVYDESSGYYYSTSLGYYYDPSSGLYCCASTGLWYSYNEEKNTYEVVEQATENAS